MPGFRSCNHPWLRLSKETLGPQATKETKLIFLAGAPPLPPFTSPYLALGRWLVSQWQVIPQRRDDLRQAWSCRGPQGRTWEAIEKGGGGPSPLGFDITWVLILSARSLLIPWLPYSPAWLKPETMLEGGTALGRNRQFPWGIWPKNGIHKILPNLLC